MRAFFWKKVVLVISLLYSPFLQAQQWQWTDALLSSNAEMAKCVSVDNAHDFVYMAGEFDAQLTRLPDTLFATYPGIRNGYVVQYDLQGNPLNYTGLGGTSDLVLQDMAVDDSGNVYLVGMFGDSADFRGDGPAGIYLYEGQAGQEIFLAKFNSDLEGQWAIKCNGSGYDQVNGLAIADGDVYVTGEFQGTLLFNANDSLVNQGGGDVFLAAFTTNGGFSWAVSGGGMRRDYANGIAVDGNHLYLTGAYESSNLTFAGNPNVTLNHLGMNSLDIFVAAFDRAGGQAIWAQRGGGNGEDEGIDISIGQNNAFMTGRYNGTASFTGMSSLTSQGAADAFLICYDKNNGAARWLKPVGAATGNDIGYAVAADGADQVYLAGEFKGNMLLDSAFVMNSGASKGGFVTCWNGDGIFQRVGYSVMSNLGTFVRDMEVGQKGIYLAGTYFNAQAEFSNAPGMSLGADTGENAYLARLGCAGFPMPLENAMAESAVLCRGDSAFVVIPGPVPGQLYQLRNRATGMLVGPRLAGGGGALRLFAGIPDSTLDLELLAFAPPTVCYSVVTTGLQFSVADPPVADLGPDTTQCLPLQYLLHPGIVGQSYAWSTGDTSASFLVTTPGLYAVTVTDSVGCLATDSVLVQGLTPPTPVLGPDTSLCAGDSLLLSPGAFAAYAWSGGGNAAVQVVQQAGVYAVTVTDGAGCQGSDSLVLSLNSLPQLMVVGLDSAYCASDSGNLLVGLPEGGTFSGPVAGSHYTPGAGPPGRQQLAYAYQDSLGCSAELHFSTWVDAVPGPVDAGPDQSQEAGDPVDLAAVPPQVGQGTWSGNWGNATISDARDPQALLSGLGVGSYALEWQVENGVCPAQKDSVIITILVEGLLIPTGFSPNGDGTNDHWNISGLGQFSRRAVKVFNRWGNVVFGADNYQSDWDGSDLPDDTYFYVLDLGDGGEYHGYVVIRR